MTEIDNEINELHESEQIVEPKGDNDVIIVDKDINVPIVRKRGRPPGSPNKNTIFKEAMTTEFRAQSEKQVRDVLEVLFKKAKGGDLKAIKLVMDRLIAPVRDEQKKESSGHLVVNISVGSMEAAQAIEIDENNYTEYEEA